MKWIFINLFSSNIKPNHELFSVYVIKGLEMIVKKAKEMFEWCLFHFVQKLFIIRWFKKKINSKSFFCCLKYINKLKRAIKVFRN